MARAIEALANPREYLAAEQAAHPYEAPDFALLEALIRFSERRLTHDVTPALIGRVEALISGWLPISSARPDLVARLERLQGAIELLRS
ncbi:MAG: hypothetical protein IPG52_04350 [Rhodocyclaceae bacterium]|nr:hypothetical protein [Rhodocyclaceae bacterium]